MQRMNAPERPGTTSVSRAAVAPLLILAAGVDVLAQLPAGEHHEIHALAETLPASTVAPFVLLLLFIAVGPLAIPRLWERHSIKAVAAGALSVPVVSWFLIHWGAAGGALLLEKAREYVSFIVLLTSLFVISGGVSLRGSLSGTPRMNTALLGVGAVLASLVGTTGASMLLVRPLLRASARREKKAHLVVFFIFIVSNCGGLLTPLGDPPLFLGFLKGVPFTWTLTHLGLPWLFVNGLLLAVFYLFDRAMLGAERKRRPGSQITEEAPLRHEPLRLEGGWNLAILAGVVVLVFLSGHLAWPFGAQETGLLMATVISLFETPEKVHRENAFSLGPIIEVAVLFFGLFATMAPALLLLNVHGATLGLSRPWHFFWATGALSSFLDNAPTYLTFAATAAGLKGIAVEGRYLARLLEHDGGGALLEAISAGAVFMGAVTYIGNGPNFMVKAVAEQSGVRMPSFFAYMACSAALLLPVLGAATWLFFR